MSRIHNGRAASADGRHGDDDGPTPRKIRRAGDQEGERDRRQAEHRHQPARRTSGCMPGADQKQPGPGRRRAAQQGVDISAQMTFHQLARSLADRHPARSAWRRARPAARRPPIGGATVRPRPSCASECPSSARSPGQRGCRQPRHRVLRDAHRSRFHFSRERLADRHDAVYPAAIARRPAANDAADPEDEGGARG